MSTRSVLFLLGYIVCAGVLLFPPGKYFGGVDFELVTSQEQILWGSWGLELLFVGGFLGLVYWVTDPDES